jgi:hypothetical protein
MRRKVDAAAATREPHTLWNAFIDLIATEDYADLSPLQRKAHLVFWYESEVQNGGHGQYFENQGVDRLRETVDALHALGLSCQARVLARAVEVLSVAHRPADWADSLSDEFVEELDAAFHNCAPGAMAALEEHLRAHEAEYVEIA